MAESELEPVLQIVEQARSFGFRQLNNGTKLFGHVPHVAPEAWLHNVFPPLADQDIVALEEKMGQPISSDFGNFLRLSNGFGLFFNSLSIYGKRTSYARTGDEVWQPFCIVTANTLERPAHAKSGQLVVGSYKSDGSLVFADARDGTAFRTKLRSKKILNRWTTFWTMLESESRRLVGLFDSQGRKMTEGPTTPPTDA